MRQGIERVGRVLADRALLPARVVAAPDRASRILAGATARVLDLPLVHWAGEETAEGLVTVWSMDAVGDAAFLQALKDHRPGQVLFVHASSWVDPFPYAPDVTTYLHQFVTNPYTGGALRVVEGETVRAEPDPRGDDALADEIAASGDGDGSRSTIEHVLAVARAISGVEEVHRGFGRTFGPRLRARAGSPVRSSRFA